jgi:ribosomal protein S18 acetylase RimI-like enzyme
VATTVRIATPEDVASLIPLILAFRNAGDDFPTEESLRSDLPRLLADGDTEFLVAGSPSCPCAGFLQQRYRHSLWLSAPEAYIEDLFVAEDARRQGIGRRLVEFAAERAKARGCPIISLDTTERNEQALSLYQGLGFSFRSERSGLRLLLRRWLGTGPPPWQRPA